MMTICHISHLVQRIRRGLTTTSAASFLAAAALTTASATASVTALLSANPAQAQEQGQSQANTVQLTSPAGTIEVVPGAGKLVVLDLSVLSTLDHLDALDQVIAAPLTGNLPDSLAHLRDLDLVDAGTVKEPNFEVIHRLNPNAIVMATRMLPVIDQLKRIAPTYYFVLDPENPFESQQAEILNIAKMVGKEVEAQAQINAIKEEIAQIRELTKGKTALFVLTNNRRISAYGPGSRFTALYDIYGFTPADPNLEVAIHGHGISIEYLIQLNPDYLFVLDRGAAINEETQGRKTLDTPLLRTTDFYKNDRLIYVNSANWYLMGDGLGALKEITEEIKNSLN